jgi:hypothetical protein
LAQLSLGWQPTVKKEAWEHWPLALDSGDPDVADVSAARTGGEGN